MIKTKRILTRKSKLNFGKHKDLTVQRLLDLRKPLVLISSYFKLTSIDFKDNILKELEIEGEYVILKPGASKELYYKFLKEKGYKRPIRDRLSGANIMLKERKINKRKLQSINHGNY
jgi:hypothetical protein